MQIIQIQFAPWDRAYNFSSNGFDLKKGDKVVVKTEIGTDIGEVVSFSDSDKNEAAASCQCPHKDKCAHREAKDVLPILRPAALADFEKMPTKEQEKEAMDYCKKTIDKHKLSMKLIDVRFSLDGSRITFAFVSEVRVDFRELVKDLTRHFNKSVRLQQIGIRDEAKIVGDCGPCGRRLCCRRFLGQLESITLDMADLQQCAHRGAERISGVCGRLMCCLAYEQKGYEELASKMPPLGVKVNVDGKRGAIVGQHVLKRSVNVEFPAEAGEKRGRVVEVDLNRDK